MGSTTTNDHEVAAFDFATVSGCDKLVVGPTHAHGETLDFLMTDVPALVQVAVVAPIGNSDHSALSAVISMDQAVPNLLLLKKVSSARLRESDVHPICPKTPAPQYQPIDRKKRKGKRVEDYSRDRAA